MDSFCATGNPPLTNSERNAMKLPIVGRGIPSALFIFSTEEGEYHLARGTNSSSNLVQPIVEAVSKTMLTTTWVYFDDLIYSGYQKSGASRTLNLFDVPMRESRISGFTDQVRFTPETFFEENEPGLVVAPFAAINLGTSIGAVIVVRDRETPVYSDDVLRSLRSFMVAEAGETSILLPDTVKRMATRIGASLDSGLIEIEGRKMFLSLGFKVEESAVVTPKPKPKAFSVKRQVAPRETQASPSRTLPFFWPPSSVE